MEFWPKKIDWKVYEAELANGDFLSSVDHPDFHCDDPPDTGSLNTALSDYFPMLLPHLDKTVGNAIGPFVGAIATCGIKGWPQSNDGPKWLYDNSKDLSDISIGQMYSPSTVSEIVQKFDSLPNDQLKTDLADAWSHTSKDPDDYKLSSIEHFEDANDFLEYLMAWFAPFREAAAEGHGIGIGGS